MTHDYSEASIRKGALIGGVVNAVINGIINWFSVKDLDKVLVSDNLISSTEHTLLSGAVPLAVSLAFILSGVAYLTTKIPNKPSYFPKIFWLSMRQTIMAFGIAVIFGVLWQRWMGSIEISPIMATICTGLIAGIVAGFVNYETVKSLVQPEKK